MAGVGLLFSGQGAQYTGMGQSLYESSPAARALFDRLEACRSGLLDLCFNGSAEELARTENTQPSVYAVDLAAAAALEEAGLHADAVAGFSLGELAALAFAGYVTPEQGFELVQRRAALMAEAAQRHPGAMLAVMRMENEAVESLCAGKMLYPVNYNCPGQLVVAGPKEDIEQLQVAVKQAGGRSIPLAVSGGFHSPFMAEAAQAMGEVYEATAFGMPGITLYSNVTGRPYGQDVAALLQQQIDHPVQWEAIMRNMCASGIDCFVEAGPGKVLAGFVARTVPDARAFSVDSFESLKKWKEERCHV